LNPRAASRSKSEHPEGSITCNQSQ
jgi:hypothetical protein